MAVAPGVFIRLRCRILGKRTPLESCAADLNFTIDKIFAGRTLLIGLNVVFTPKCLRAPRPFDSAANAPVLPCGARAGR
jgi:hypothetical protein